MIELSQAVILTGIETYCCLVFFDAFFIKKTKTQNIFNSIILILFTLSMLAVSMAGMKNYLIKSCVVVLIMAFFMAMIYEIRISQLIFYSICYYGILFTTDFITITILSILLRSRMDYFLQDKNMITIVSILCKLVLYFIVNVIKHKLSITNTNYLIENKIWISFLFFPVFSVVAIVLFLTENCNSKSTDMVISFGLLIANFIMLYVVENLVSRERDKEYNRNQMKMYHSMKTTFQEQRIKYHEFKNHMECIRGLLQQNEITKVKEYVSLINRNFEGDMNYINTQNPFVNAIVNQKIRQSKDKGICLVTALDKLENFCMKEDDVVILLANLLDNAIECCEKLENKMIKFKFLKEEDKYILSVRNPVAETVQIINNRIKTTKENRLYHGIGMPAIRNIIDKYGGNGICTCHNGYFCYTIIFMEDKIRTLP